jgi:hypothetical protein
LQRLLEGQTNFVKMLWKFNSVYDPKLQLADHARPVKYEMRLPDAERAQKVDPRTLYVHAQGARRRQVDEVTEAFVRSTGGRHETPIGA